MVHFFKLLFDIGLSDLLALRFLFTIKDESTLKLIYFLFAYSLLVIRSYQLLFAMFLYVNAELLMLIDNLHCFLCLYSVQWVTQGTVN